MYTSGHNMTQESQIFLFYKAQCITSYHATQTDRLGRYILTQLFNMH